MKPGLVGLTCAMFVVGFAAQSCATNVSLGPGLDDAGTEVAETGSNVFVPAPDSGVDAAAFDATAPPLETLKECVGTKCTWPRATCGDGVTARCEVDLLNDNNNCGECGHKCEEWTILSVATQCYEGRCRPFCTSATLQDCNGLIDDGCESTIASDRNNCGACGNKCPDGVPCSSGSCGCPPGTELCNGQCVDLGTDNNNCGACGTACPSVAKPCDPNALPKNVKYKCAKGQCGQFVCSSTYWGDCNGDLKLGCGSADGCETDLSTDPNNCGRCGNQCAPGQLCRIMFGDKPQCVCGPGETLCGPVGPEYSCVDVSNDPKNCGACGHVCPSTPNADAVCRSGVCGFECPKNKADCNGTWADGCEVDLLTNMKNCGACGQACDVDGGQPCINGTCLMVECDAGIPH